MAEGLIKGMTSEGGSWDIMVSEPVQERRDYLEKTYGVMATANSVELCEASGIIVLAVKPQQVDEVIDAIKQAVTPDKTVVSIAAGIKLAYYENRLNTTKIIRLPLFFSMTPIRWCAVCQSPPR